jgi:hypothetical protein
MEDKITNEYYIINRPQALRRSFPIDARREWLLNRPAMTSSTSIQIYSPHLTCNLLCDIFYSIEIAPLS